MANSVPERFDVAIAGGSFAGLALARALSMTGGGEIRVAVIDRAAGPPPGDDGRALAIWAGAKAFLDALGVWPLVAGDAIEVSSIEITDSALDDGVRQPRLVYDARLGDGGSAAYMTPASALHRALYAVIENDPSIARFAPADAAALSLGDDAAMITLADGRDIEASLAVAADGRTSKLRGAAGIATVGWDYDQIGIVAIVEFDAPHDNVAVQHFLPGGPFAILPMRDNRACITWSAARDEAQRMLALDDDAFAVELDKRIAGRFGAVKLVGPRRSWPLDLKVPRALTAKRFALIGDAAHGVHPIAGQGANLALRDAAALAECVVDAMRIGLDAGHAPALDRYSRWRRFDSIMSASLYEGLNRAFSVDGIVLRAGRGVGLGVIDRLPDLKRLILAEAAGQTGELPKLMRGAAV